jgi:hypothetical protein
MGRQNDEIMEYFSLVLCVCVEVVPEHRSFHVIFQLMQYFCAKKLAIFLWIVLNMRRSGNWVYSHPDFSTETSYHFL